MCSCGDCCSHSCLHKCCTGLSSCTCLSCLSCKYKSCYGKCKSIRSRATVLVANYFQFLFQATVVGSTTISILIIPIIITRITLAMAALTTAAAFNQQRRHVDQHLQAAAQHFRSNFKNSSREKILLVTFLLLTFNLRKS